MKKTVDKRSVLQECRRYIEEHLSEELDPEVLAARCGYACSSFRRVFRESTGYSFHKYIRLRRLYRAARLLREGGSLAAAVEAGGFETRSGFNKAFAEEFGVSSARYAASRGRVLMREPKLSELPEFCVIGYALNAEPGASLRQEDCGAYWLGKELPSGNGKSPRHIGGGEKSVGLWLGPPGEGCYLIGPPSLRQGFVPPSMESIWVPGGLFARFPIPPFEKGEALCEAVRASWYYALHQWLPDSLYEEDRNRLRYEYYGKDVSAVLIPVKPRAK